MSRFKQYMTIIQEGTDELNATAYSDFLKNLTELIDGKIIGQIQMEKLEKLKENDRFIEEVKSETILDKLVESVKNKQFVNEYQKYDSLFNEESLKDFLEKFLENLSKNNSIEVDLANKWFVYPVDRTTRSGPTHSNPSNMSAGKQHNYAIDNSKRPVS